LNLVFLPATSGTYYVKVAGLDGTSGSYTINIFAVVVDEFEPDDTVAEAKPIATDGTVQNHTVDSYQPADYDWMSFDAAAGGTYTATANFTRIQGRITFLTQTVANQAGDPVGNAITAGLPTAVGFTGVTLSFTPTAGGRHYLLANRVGGPATGSYTISLTGPPPAPAIGIVSPTASQVFPAGTTEITAQVLLENADHWHWLLDGTGFPPEGTAGGTMVAAGVLSAPVAVGPGAHTLYVAAVDASMNILATASVSFTVASGPPPPELVWQFSGLPGAITPAILATPDGRLFAGTQGSGISRSLDAGGTWQLASTGLTSLDVRALAIQGTTLLAGTQNVGVERSLDGGNTWQVANAGMTVPGPWFGTWSFAPTVSTPGTTLYAGTNGGGVYRSADGGYTWQAINTGLTDMAIPAVAVVGTTAYAGTWNAGVFRFDSAGNTWQSVNTGLAALNIRSLGVAGTTLFAGTYANGIFRSLDGGNTWEPVNTGLTNLSVWAFRTSGTTIYAGTWGGGVFRSLDNGSSWTAANNGLTNSTIQALTTSDPYVYAATAGGGVFRAAESEPLPPPSLLVNGDGSLGTMAGWTILENGGDGWAVIDGVFRTSFGWDRRSQTIDLVASGFSTAELDASPPIAVSERFSAVDVDGADPYYLRVELRRGDNSVIAAFTRGTPAAPLTVAIGASVTESFVFSGYGPGLRYIYWEDGGKDAGIWSGHFGTALDDAIVSIESAPPPQPSISVIGLDTVPDPTSVQTYFAFFAGVTASVHAKVALAEADHWHWQLDGTPFPTTGPVPTSNMVASDVLIAPVTVPVAVGPASHTLHVAAVDATMNILATASVPFTVEGVLAATGHLMVTLASKTHSLEYGISPSASFGVDPLDVMQPPPPPESVLDARLERPELINTVEYLRRYRADIVPLPPVGPPVPLEWTLWLGNLSATEVSVRLTWQGAAALLAAAGEGYTRATLSATHDPLSVDLGVDDTVEGVWITIPAFSEKVFNVRLYTARIIQVNYNVADGWNLFSTPGVGSMQPLLPGYMAAYGWGPDPEMGQGYFPVLPENFSQTMLPPVTSGWFYRPMPGPIPTGGVGTVSLSLNMDDPSVTNLTSVFVDNGWNLIGAPFSETGVPASRVNAGLPGTFQGYDPLTGYYVADTLHPGRGYWLFVAYGGRMIDLSQPTEAPIAPSAQPVVAMPNPDWMFRLMLELPNGVGRHVALGSARSADVSFDKYDIPLPPHPDATAPEFYADVDHFARRLSRSVLPIGREGAEWTLTARMPVDDGVLRWDAPRLPAGYRVFLEVNGRTVDMAQARMVSLPRGVHTLRAFVRWEAPNKTRLLANFPNPFNPETWIPFELKEDADVSVRIYTPSGVLVRALALGRREAGYYTSRADAAYWDGRNEVGEEVASGVYFYELQAGTTRQMRRMVIVR
jgi:hypothetical protein